MKVVAELSQNRFPRDMQISNTYEKGRLSKLDHSVNYNLTFGATVCFNACQTSNVWRQNTFIFGTLLQHVFLSRIHA